MTNRLLTMLSQYLTSNQGVRLNDSFQIYFKVLSIDHLNYKKNIKKKKVPKRTFATHVGAKASVSMRYWALDPPSKLFHHKNKEGLNLFEDKCLLLCTIFALLQHTYFENKTNKGYLMLLKLFCKDVYKKSKAHQFLAEQLQELFSVTNLQAVGPYHLQTTIKLLSETYKCQFFIFDGLSNSNKLAYMFPFTYDDSLKPIYLYRPAHERDHVAFIKHVRSYFRSNYAICFACKRKFKDSYHKHLCKEKKCCFVCRRFLQTSTTYLNERLEYLFCDKDITMEKPFKCQICNCTIYSKKCFKGHRKLCNGKGYFGYKCDNCQKFLTSSRGQTSLQIKTNHLCSRDSQCKFCFQKEDAEHFCKLKHFKLSSFHTRLGFFKIHTLSNEPYLPLLALILREESNDERRGQFTKYVFSHELLQESNQKIDNFFNFSYFCPNTKHYKLAKGKISEKITADYQINIAQLQKTRTFNTDLLLYFLDKNDTTYICQDEHSYTMVTIFLTFLNDHDMKSVVDDSDVSIRWNVGVLKTSLVLRSFLSPNSWNERYSAFWHLV